MDGQGHGNGVGSNGQVNSGQGQMGVYEYYEQNRQAFQQRQATQAQQYLGYIITRKPPVVNQQPVNQHWTDQMILYNASKGPYLHFTINGMSNRWAKAPESAKSPFDQAPPASDRVAVYEDHRGLNHSSEIVSRQDWAGLDVSGYGIVRLSPRSLNYKFFHSIFLTSNRLTKIPAEIGTLRTLRFLDVSHNELTELPPELGMCFWLEFLTLFDNKISTLPGELGALTHLKMLGIQGNPIDPGIMHILLEKGTKELIFHLRENAPVPLPPRPRVMIDLPGDTMVSGGAETIKILTYNILCDKYATMEKYEYVPSGALSWDYRKEKIMEEIQAADADIICLQEVNTESFKEFFCMKLADNDYKGVFWPRSRARTMTDQEAKLVDGCATFYKSSKYILLDKQLVDFTSLAINRPDMKNQMDIFKRVMPRDNIAIITFFENRLSGERLIVANTHIFSNPRYADVKAIQTAILMEFLTRQAAKYADWPACTSKKPYANSADNSPSSASSFSLDGVPAASRTYPDGPSIPLFIVGDFNSQPGSAVQHLLSMGYMAPGHMDLWPYSYGKFTRAPGMAHPFWLRSAYAALDKTADAVRFTNYTTRFEGVLDYIWYSEDAFVVVRLLGGVDEEYLRRTPGFPNWHFPSDHICLLAEFMVLKTGMESAGK